MAVDVGQVRYKVEADTRQLENDVDRAGSTITSKLSELSSKMSRSFGYQVLKDIGSAFIQMGQQAVQAFANISQAAVQSAASLEQNIGGTQTLFKSAADQVIANAQAAYKTAGMSTNTYLSTVNGFAASLLQSTKSTVKSISAETVQAQSDALDKQYDQTKRAYDKQYDAVKKSYDKQYDAASKTFDKEYDARKKQLDKVYDAYSDALDAEIEAAEKAYDDRIEAAEKAYDADVAAYEKATEARLKLIDQEYRESLKLIDREEYERLQAIDAEIAALNAQTDAENKAQEQAERDQKRAELQKAVNTAESAEEREKAQKALSDWEAKIALKDQQERRKEQIAALKDQKSAIKEETSARKDAAKEQRDIAVDAVKEESKETLAAMKSQHSAELKALQEAKAAQTKAMKAAAKENLAALKESQNNELETLREGQKEQLEALKESQEAQLEAYKDAQDEKLSALKKSLEAQKKALTASNNALAENVKATAEEEAKAAEYANMAVLDMADNANKMGTPIESLQNAYAGFAKGNFTMLDNLKLGYGGTRGEMERLIEDANRVKEANGEMADLSIDSFADIVEAIHIIQGEMGITGATAEEASSTVEGSMNAAKAAYDNFLNGTISGEEFGETLVTAATNLVNMFVETWNGIAEETPALLGALIGTDKAEELINAISPITDEIAKLTGQTGDAEDQAKKADEAFTTFCDTLNVIATAVATVVDAVASFVGWLDSGKTSAETFKAVILAVAVALGTYNAIMTTVKAITTAVDVAQKLLNGTMLANPIALVAAAIAGLVVAFIYLWNNCEEFREFWIKLWDKIKEAYEKVAEGLKTFFDETLPNAIDNVVQWFKDLPENAAKWAGELIENFITGLDTGSLWDWGRDLVANFVNGIYSGFQWLNDAAIWVANTVRAFLGFSEPDKGPLSNFHTFAPDMMALYAEGIEDNVDLVEESVYKVSKSISGGLDVNYGLPDISGYAADLGASITASNQTRIEVPVVLDGREVARATAWYSNEQLAWEAR